VGVFAIKNGEWNVVEYSEISKEMAERRDPKTNELVFNASNLCIFLFTVKFLERCEKVMRETKVHHIARKKIPCADENGNTIIPKDNNGVKVIWDLFSVDEYNSWSCSILISADYLRRCYFWRLIGI
jgi:UDP-N-acetylglucosamine/UDP-N-acetylgalactosamine diphosphorylase